MARQEFVFIQERVAHAQCSPEIRNGEESVAGQVEGIIVYPIIEQDHPLGEAAALTKPGHTACTQCTVQYSSTLCQLISRIKYIPVEASVTG